MSEQDVRLDAFIARDDDEWRSVKLEDVAEKRSENVDPQKVDLDKHVGLEHIRPNNPYPDWESVDGLSSTKRRFEPGDVLFAKLRPNLEKAAQPDFEGVASTDIFPIIARPRVNAKFLLYRLSSKEAFDTARRTSVGTRMPRTSWSLFSNFEFDLPPLEEQRKIATVLYTTDQVVKKTDEFIEQLYRVKKGALQCLYTHGTSNSSELESTSVGKVPRHWDVATIGDVVEMAQYGISESLQQEGEYPIFRMNNIENGYMVGEPMKYIDLDDEEFEKYRVEHGDILFNRTNSHELVGKTGLFDLEGDYVFASYLVRLRTNEKVDPYYLNYYMNSKRGQDRLKAFATKGVSQSNINATNVQRVELPLPPLEEQEEIARVIRSIDEAIASNNEYKEQICRVKRSLIQDLLSGKIRTDDLDINIPAEVKNHEPE